MTPDLQAKARILLALHHGDRILILPNAWDAGSARVFAAAGFPAIATTSAGVAFTYGKPDGQRISAGEMLSVVGRIASAVTVPVTADVEAGYGDISGTVRGVLDAGAVGMNLEDMDGDGSAGLTPLAEQVERVKAVRTASDSLGVHIVLNARTDVFLAGIGDPAQRLPLAIERLRAYAEAGADCLFVPAVKDEDVIRELVQALPKPVNLLAAAGLPPVGRLRELGVARVSTGSGPARAALSVAQAVADQLLSTGEYSVFTECSLSYAAANQLFER
ncbi:isocitrate lyase/phosphoenolpyruvate mutase family protein [uncultured Paludibaculum sp.]|uniref:isocitrate lyase/PEP mutase family protein n=1 Tax=uncultured Paludibaculum sp. TaxID=1765020 RepID=UPI002AAA9A14|nr:isocitrate lyase/phosphoenolpyruvate mutase family protein [uncultured Paludibaculum sp.]